MQAPMIVKAFDPIDDVQASLSSGFVLELIDALDLQRLEEAFHRCVVPAVAPVTHRLQHPEIVEQLAVLRAGAAIPPSCEPEY